MCMFLIGNRFKKKHLLVSESSCRIAIVLFIYVSYTNKICLYQYQMSISLKINRTIGYMCLLYLTIGPSWSYGIWIYNYLCNQCLSPLKL